MPTDTNTDPIDGPLLLKTLIDATVVDELSARVAAVWPPFDRPGFEAAANADLAARALKARSAHIADCLRQRLPEPFEQAIAIVLESLPVPDDRGGIEGVDGFRYMPLLDVVGRHGTDDPEPALDALETLTLHFSAEFAIRPFLARFPDRTWPRIDRWAGGADWRLRRLASEGTRPRLPWGERLAASIADPGPGIAVLDRLHADPHPVVRRSVANHLNDVAKDHPDRAVDVATRWWEQSDGAGRGTVRHALRGLVKAGNTRALELMGFHGGDAVAVKRLTVRPDTVRLGEAVTIEVQLHSTAPSPINLVIDYRLDRPIAGGRRSSKVFKLATRRLEPGCSASLERRIVIRQLSTRTYHPGSHEVHLMVNGLDLGSASFELVG
ncbi:MAG: DNA alkylation repair protein [Pseudomonadota bacterium]